MKPKVGMLEAGEGEAWTCQERTTDGSEAQKPNPSPAANHADQPTQNRHGFRPDENDRVKLDVGQTARGPGDAETHFAASLWEKTCEGCQWTPGALPGVKARSETLQRPARPRRFETAGSGTPCGKERKRPRRMTRSEHRRRSKSGIGVAGQPTNRAYSFVRWQD